MNARPEVGDLIPCPILEGEESSGVPAGLPEGYRLRGVGLRPMRDLYQAAELTEFCRQADTCWAAEIIEIPR